MDIAIVPSQVFDKPYSKILNSIDGLITKTERKMLLMFERFCYKDGLIFPKQSTIATKLNLSQRQVIRIINSLKSKGFISVTKPSLNERHLYGKGNNYNMLNHPSYDYHKSYDDYEACEDVQKNFSNDMSHEMTLKMSYENEDHTIIYNKRLKETKRFDEELFLLKNKNKHPMAIEDALRSLKAKWETIKAPMAYAQKIVDVQSGNYNASDFYSQEDDKGFEKGYKAIAKELGVVYTGEREVQNEETYNDIVHRKEEQKRMLFEMFKTIV